MLSPRCVSLRRRVCSFGFLWVAALLAAGTASAQSTASPDPSPVQSSTTGYSSSQEGLSESGLQLAEFTLPDSAFPGSASSAGGASGAGQYGTGEGAKHGIFHNLAFEAGGGFNGPIGNDAPFITWGGNFTVGGGLRFSRMFSALLEYQFIDDKLPAGFIAAESANSNAPITAGNAHINAITGSPVIDLFPKKSNGVYLVGGFGYYHKSTNFNGYECCGIGYFGYYDVEVTLASVTSNQWGGNAGLGIYHRLGGMYGGSKSQLFAEARYTYIHTPTASANGFGTTELIPVTFGIRF